MKYISSSFKITLNFVNFISIQDFQFNDLFFVGLNS